MHLPGAMCIGPLVELSVPRPTAALTAASSMSCDVLIQIHTGSIASSVKAPTLILYIQHLLVRVLTC